MAFICFFNYYYGFYMAYMAFGHRFRRRDRVCEEFGCQRVDKNMWICAVPSGRMQI